MKARTDSQMMQEKLARRLAAACRSFVSSTNNAPKSIRKRGPNLNKTFCTSVPQILRSCILYDQAPTFSTPITTCQNTLSTYLISLLQYTSIERKYRHMERTPTAQTKDKEFMHGKLKKLVRSPFLSQPRSQPEALRNLIRYPTGRVGVFESEKRINVIYPAHRGQSFGSIEFFHRPTESPKDPHLDRPSTRQR